MFQLPHNIVYTFKLGCCSARDFPYAPYVIYAPFGEVICIFVLVQFFQPKRFIGEYTAVFQFPYNVIDRCQILWRFLPDIIGNESYYTYQAFVFELCGAFLIVSHTAVIAHIFDSTADTRAMSETLTVADIHFHISHGTRPILPLYCKSAGL